MTLVTNGDDFTIDISNNNQLGYSPEHKILFRAKLASALKNGGGITIRQFLSVRTKQKIFNGKEMWIPEKNLYGAVLGNNNWIGMDIQTLKMAYETDATTGLPLTQERGTHYRNFPIK